MFSRNKTAKNQKILTSQNFQQAKYLHFQRFGIAYRLFAYFTNLNFKPTNQLL